MFTLRKYQQEAVDDIMKDEQNCILCSPTASGKSAHIQHIVKQYFDIGKKCAVIVRTASLIEQLEKDLLCAGSVGVIKDGYDFDPEADIVLIMEQTYYSRYEQYNLNIDVAIKDEFHISYNGKQFNHIINILKPKRVIGLTATPIDETGVCLIYLLTGYRYIERVSIEELIELGYLHKPTYVKPSRIDFENAIRSMKKQGTDYSSKEIDMTLNNDEYNQFIVDEWKSDYRELKTMFFCNSIEHVEAVSKKLSEANIEHVFIHSKRKSEDNAKAIKAYRENKVKVVVNMSMLTTGFDDPETECIVLARPTKILRLAIQIIGRVLRTHQNKRLAIVLDLCGMLREFGFVEDYKNFDLFESKEKANEIKEENALDELHEIKGKKINKEKLYEFRLHHKTKRIDELSSKLEAITDAYKSLKGKYDRLIVSISKIKIENETLKNAYQKIKNSVTQKKEYKMDSFLTFAKEHLGKEFDDVYKVYTDCPLKYKNKSCTTRLTKLLNSNSYYGTLGENMINFIKWIEEQHYSAKL